MGRVEKEGGWGAWERQDFQAVYDTARLEGRGGCEPCVAYGYANEIPIWMDYFSLRQCGNDFDLNRVNDVVQAMPVFVAAAASVGYVSRTFCVFELFRSYVARVAGQRLIVGQLW